MAEQLDLAVPDQSTPGTAFYRVSGLFLDWDAGYFYVELLGSDGLKRQEKYKDGNNAQGTNEDAEDSTIATDRMRALNKADLSVQSLQNRILKMLTDDGRLPGVVTGDPE